MMYRYPGLCNADGVMLVVHTQHELQSHVGLQARSDRLRRFGLHHNTTAKTEYLDTSSHQGSIQVNGDTLKKTGAFRYLGSKLLVDGGINGEARARVGTR